MRARLDALEALFKQLRLATTPKAQRLFNKLRVNTDVQLLLDSLDKDGGHDNEDEDIPPAIQEQEHPTAELAARLPDHPSRRNFSNVEQAHSGPVTLRDAVPKEQMERLSWNIEVPAAPATRAAVDNFFGCAGTLLHVFTREQAESFHDEAFSGTSQTPSWKASVCCLCAIAAIGKVYHHDPDASGGAKRYYDVAKGLFEDLVEIRSLDAIKVCTLLALFNIFDKATLAVVHVGMFYSQLSDKSGAPNKLARSRDEPRQVLRARP
jgi:hypothetical protein